MGNNKMKINAKITLIYENEKIAKNIQKALRIDDGTFVKSIIKKNELIATIENDSLPSFLQTIDDYLSCVTVSENIVNTNLKEINIKRKNK
jgi:hypothetical protein